ncbi:cell wall-binding repeat-containing protein [Candidatus Poriferisodalis sp.]|uniref:cell wall-binding repeat-containing protein n=1 Tax=Candidatus Poriferisodalis sp. TaxID=3101277 RepID=UPI003B525B6C
MRRLAAVLLSVVVGLGGALGWPARTAAAAADDDLGVEVLRYGGADRYAMSLLIAEAVAAEAGGSLSSVVLVSGERWTDAVVAASVAGASGASVLMTSPDGLRADALAFLGRASVTDAVVIGPDAGGGEHGPGRGVSAGVLEALAQAGITASRVSGSDRYSTGVAAARQITPGVMPGLGRTAIVASGEVFADALVAGPYAARGGHPVLLCRLCAPLVLADPAQIPADTASYLDAARGGNAAVDLRVFGGNSAVSQAAIDLYLSGANPATDHDDCRPPSLSNVRTTVGFPLSEAVDPSSGRVKITVLFMDFPDAQASHATHEEVASGLPVMEEYLEAQSYGKLDLDIDVVHHWWRAPHEYRTYLADDAAGATGLWPSAGAESVRLADDSYDFSDTDVVLTVFPSDHFGRGLALGYAYADETALSGLRINTHPGTGAGVPWNWGLTAAHELVHNFGLVDLYPYDASLHSDGDPPDGTAWVSVEIGLMGLKARYSHSDFSLWLATPAEMLAWTRWQLGWLEPAQVVCGVRLGAPVPLQPVARPGTGTAMTIVPLNEHEMIVIENRRRLGYDATAPDTHQSGAAPRHGLLEEGVLVYTMDSRVDNGQLPIKIAGDSGNGLVDDFPVLQLGERVTLRGYTITVTADKGDAYTVTITR